MNHARRPRTAALALLLLAAVPRVATAQADTFRPPADVTLEDVLRLLQEHSARTLADRASVTVAEAERLTAQALPNPTASYDAVHLVSGLSTGAVTEHQFSVEQPLLLFRQRQARLAAADAGVSTEQARVAQTLAARRASVRAAFVSLLARQERLRILHDSLGDLEQVQQLVRGRASAGDRSQYDVTRVEVETGTLQAQALDASADVDDAAGQLAVLLGFPGWTPHAVGSLESGTVSTDMGLLWDTARQRRPSIVTLQRQQAAARAGLLLARHERMIVPSLSAGAQTTRDVNGTSAYVGLSVPLPLFDRGQGPIARTTAELTAADLELQAGLAEARADVESAAAALARRRDALASFERTVGDRVPALRRMAADAYREGSADILELIDANRSVREIQLARVEQLEAIEIAEAQVIAAAALDEPEVPAAP